MSHWEIQLDSLTVKIHWKTFLMFFFFHFCLISAPCFEEQCGDLGFMQSTCLDQCVNSAPYPYLAYSDQGFTDYASLPACGNCEKNCFLVVFPAEICAMVLG
jgi:hypothetical protein